MTATPADGGRNPLHTIFAYSLPGATLAGVALVYGVYLPRFYASLIGNFALVGGAFAIVRFVDVWLDPFLALVMDRTKTPIGRYRPWVVLSAPILMLGLYKVLLPQGSVGSGYLILWLLVSYLGVSILTLSTTAWTTVLAVTYDERSRLWGWSLGIAVVGSVVLLLLPLLTNGALTLGKGSSMASVGVILVVSVPIAVAICAVFTPERLTGASTTRFSLRDYGAAISRPTMLRLTIADLLLSLGVGTTAPLYVYFFHDAKGFTIAEVGFLLVFYIGATIVGAPVWGRVARSIGKHRTLQISCVCYALAQAILMALPRVWPGHTFIQMVPTIVLMFAVGFTASAFLLLVRAMVADAIDEVKLEQGQDITSLLYSMVTTTTKIGGSVTTVLSFGILAMVGYNPREGAVNTPHAIFGLEMCYLFAPIILVFLGGGLFFGYKLDAKRHAEIRAALEARDGHTAELPVAEAEGSLIR